MKLCKCSCLCTILIRLAIETEDSFIPSVSDCNCDFIFFCKLLCHIIDLILQSVMIACPARCHAIITYCLSIQCHLIYTMCSCIQMGFLYLFINCKCFSKYRACCLFCREITCDHLCDKLCIVKNSCLKCSSDGFYISMVICHRHLYFIEHFICQCFSFIRNQN